MGGCVTKQPKVYGYNDLQSTQHFEKLKEKPDFFEAQWPRQPIQGLEHISRIEYGYDWIRCLEFSDRPFGFALGDAESGNIGAVVEFFYPGSEALEDVLPIGSRIVYFNTVQVKHLERRQIEYRLKQAKFSSTFCIQFEVPYKDSNIASHRKRNLLGISLSNSTSPGDTNSTPPNQIHEAYEPKKKKWKLLQNSNSLSPSDTNDISPNQIHEAYEPKKEKCKLLQKNSLSNSRSRSSLSSNSTQSVGEKKAHIASSVDRSLSLEAHARDHSEYFLRKVVDPRMRVKVSRNITYKKRVIRFSRSLSILGMTVNSSGVVQTLYKNVRKRGVRNGWKIVSINGKPFSQKRFAGASRKRMPVKIKFQTTEYSEPQKFVVISPDGIIVRETQDLSSPEVAKIGTKEILMVVERFGRRVRIISPEEGWVSVRNRKAYRLILEVR